MTEFLCRFVRWLNETRALHHFVAVLAMIAGGFYLLFPPVTTIGFFSGSWPPTVWGCALLLGGVVKEGGLVTRVLDWQLLGLTLIFAGTLSLATAQTMVMLGPPLSLTRGGGVAALWILVALVGIRLVIVACDRDDGRQAQEQTDEGR